MIRMRLRSHEMRSPIPYRGRQSGGPAPVAGERASMNVQSVALRALWRRGLVVAVVVVAALVAMASVRPAASPAAR